VRSAVVLALLGLTLGAGTLWARSAAGSSLATVTCPLAGSGASHGKSLGHVASVDRDRAYVGTGTSAARLLSTSFQLYAGNVVCTDRRGIVSVQVDSQKSHARCTIDENSRFTLGLANGQAVLSYRPGRYNVTCAEQRGLIELPHKTELKPSPDPVFTIAVRPDRSVISIRRGFLKIGRPGTAPTRIVGPDEQVAATLTSISRPTGVSGLEPDQNQLLTELASALPKPAYARPSSPTALERSATLQRIGNTRQIVVGLGPGLSDDASLAFVGAYFQFLAVKWQLGKRKPVVLRHGLTPSQARALLGRGRIDLYLTQSPPKKTLKAPFFADHAGNTWQFVVKGDSVFLHSMTTFLQATLDTGDYAKLYTSIAKLPIYSAVAPLIFPTIKCAPNAHADLTSLLDLRLDLTASPSGPLPPGAQVGQTATVTNVGRRIVDCVTLNFQVFGGLPLNDAALVRSGCTQTFPATLAEVDLSCELGRLTIGQTKSLRVIVKPAGSSAYTQTCADVNADESGGLPEVNRADNSACAGLVYRTGQQSPLVVGAAEDKVQYSPDPASDNPLDKLAQGAKFELLKQAGFGAVVVTAHWVPGRTTPFPGQLAELRAAAAAAEANGIDLVLAVYNFDDTKPQPLTAVQDTPATGPRRRDFAAYTASLVRSVKGVRTVIVGNEPNNGQFWMPQYGPRATDVAAGAYEALLAQTYDAVKAVDSSITVVGGALAPRGADVPKPGRDSHSPVTFISDLGLAYKQSGRTTPIMDAFALHPLPESAATPPTTQHPSPTSVLGIADYQFLVSVLGRGFDGTAQQGSTLPIYYTEYAVRSAPRQAEYYRQAISIASCQPTVRGLFIFHAFDQPRPSPWQTGVYGVNGLPKPSLATFRAAASAAQARNVSSCPPFPRTP
jgi:hypothetical protein